MKVQCPSCKVGFSVPDEKIPQGKEVRLLCPKCRLPIELSRDDVPPAPEPLRDADIGGRLDESDVPMDLGHGNMDAVLLCVSDRFRREKLEKSLKAYFYVNAAASSRAAMVELRHNRYDIVMVDEAFDGGSIDMNPILRYVQPLPMQIRRSILLCIVSDSLPTSDYMTAFRMGSNLTVNYKDLDKTKAILDRTIKEHKLFYKVFREELEAKGRA